MIIFANDDMIMESKLSSVGKTLELSREAFVRRRRGRIARGVVVQNNRAVSIEDERRSEYFQGSYGNAVDRSDRDDFEAQNLEARIDADGDELFFGLIFEIGKKRNDLLRIGGVSSGKIAVGAFPIVPDFNFAKICAFAFGHII